MAIAKFTIEMAADLSQLRRDVQNINAVVSQMGGQIAKSYAPSKAAMDEVGKAHGKMADQAQLSALAQQKAAKQTSYQNVQLANQLQDFAIQVAGGANPLLAFAQQGSQLSAVYGGAGAALRAVTALITPLNVAIAAGAAAVGGLVYAFIKGDEQSAEFRKSLVLTGNAAGMTAGRFEASVQKISESADIGSGKAREIAQALVATGRFGPQGFEQLAQSAAALSKLTGKTATEVAQEFTRMADSPSQFAASMNRTMNFLTDKQLQYIKTLEANGQRQEAMFALQEALASRLGQQVPQSLGYIETALAKSKKAWNDFWDAAFNVGRTEPIEKQLERLSRIIEQKRAGLAAVNPDSRAARVLQQELNVALQEQAGIQETIRLQRRSADAESTKAATERTATEKRELEERLRNQNLALAAARQQLSSKDSILAADKEIYRIEQSLALSADQSPQAQQLAREAIARQELIKLGKEEAQIQGDIARARASVIKTDPSTAIQAETQITQLRIRQKEIDAQRERIGASLLFGQQSMLRAQRDEGYAWSDKVRSIQEATREYQLQLEAVGKSALAVQQITELRKINERFRTEEEALNRREDITAEQRRARQAQIAQEREAQLRAYAQLHADRYVQIYSAERGVSDAILEYTQRTREAGLRTREATATILTSMEDGIVRFVTTGKLSIRDFANTVIAEFVRIKVAQPFVNAIAGGDWVGKLFGAGGSSSGRTLDAGSVPIAGNLAANGMAFGSGGLRAFARGGAFTNKIVTRPTRFAFAGGAAMGLMGEAGAEAVMPLRRDSRGRLGVILSGGDSSAPPVTVNVINQGSNMEVTGQRVSRNSGGGFSVDVMVRQVQDALADNVSAGSGSLFQAMSGRFMKAGMT